MADQTYANHRQRSTLWLVAFGCGFLAFVVMVLFVLRQPGLLAGGMLLMSIAVMCAVLMVRGYALKLQDRIIRLEMQTRLARLGLEGELARLEKRQVIALRFASDAELPALVGRAVTEKLTADQIKRAVTSWQADVSRV